MKFSNLNLNLNLNSILTTFSLISNVLATTSCSADNHCPEDFPCCSSTGTCGTGSYCLNSCDPRFSFNSSSCLPAPICKSGSFTPRLSNMISQDDYLGNSTDADFTYYGDVVDSNNSVEIRMPSNSTGGLIASTFYIWYGKVSYKFKTSHNAGVISAAILFSQVQDEIDFEFVGSQLDIAESNFYFEGTLNYSNSADLSTTDTYENYHTYEIDWQQDSITWSIDGVSMRTLKKSDTFNETSGEYSYPQTPSRIQFSIWPVTSSSAEGTREWAGGAIDWDASDFTDPGYLYIGIDTVEVNCYDPPSDAKIDGNISYIYDGNGFLEENIIISNNLTWIENLGDTGFNNGQDDYFSKLSASSASKYSSSSKISSTKSSSVTKSSSSSKQSSSKSSSKQSSSTSSSKQSSSTSSSKQSSSKLSSKSISSSKSSSKSISSSKLSSKSISSSKAILSSSKSSDSSSKKSASPSIKSSIMSTASLISTSSKNDKPITTVKPNTTTSIPTSISKSSKSLSSSVVTITKSSSSSSSSTTISGFVQYAGISTSTSTYNNAPKNQLSFISIFTLIASSLFLI